MLSLEFERRERDRGRERERERERYTGGKWLEANAPAAFGERQ